MKILDFGLAYNVDSTMADIHSIVGTNNWMAPEI